MVLILFFLLYKYLNIFKNLRNNGIGVQVHYIPVYLQPFYRKLGLKKTKCLNADDFYQKELSIPLFPSMNEEERDFVIKTVFEVLGRV